MLLIAVSYGYAGDPYTCSASTHLVDPQDPNACRDFLCQSQGLNKETVDEVLAVWAVMNGVPEIAAHHVYEDEFDDDMD